MCWRADYFETLYRHGECPDRVDGFSFDFDGWVSLIYESGFPTMTPEQRDRALQLRRLQGLGEGPTQEELGGMRWPQRGWWADRDRIGECQSLIILHNP